MCLLVSVFNPASPVRDEMQGVYMERELVMFYSGCQGFIEYLRV